MAKVEQNEKLVDRILQILQRLMNGKKLYTHSLADEFKVSFRTIQRDLNQRMGFLELEWGGSGIERFCFLHPSKLGVFALEDIQDFARLAGVRHLFPKMTDQIFQRFITMRISESYLVHGHHYESLDGKESLFKKMGEAIEQNKMLDFSYLKDAEIKQYTAFQPYKMINHKGIWYLVGLDGEKQKAFRFTRLQQVFISENRFEIKPDIAVKINNQQGIWFGETLQEVLIQVDQAIADYFKRRQLVPHQEITKEQEDGGLIISCKVGHFMQIASVIRYWIPHARIVSPKRWQQDIEEGLRQYVQNANRVS